MFQVSLQWEKEVLCESMGMHGEQRELLPVHRFNRQQSRKWHTVYHDSVAIHLSADQTNDPKSDVCSTPDLLGRL